MEIKLILINLIKVLLDIVEVLQSQAQVALSKLGGATFSFEPHALHIMDIETFLTLVFAEKSHSFLGLFNLVISDQVP